MMAHTPGPWRVWDETSVWQDADSDDPSSYALIKAITQAFRGGNGRDHISRDEAEANARLIAAAPDLLAALREYDRLSLVIESAARNEHQVNPSACARIVAAILAARAAIAKAESL